MYAHLRHLRQMFTPRDQGLNIAGFKASAMISHWLKRRVRVRPMTEGEAEEAATKIQAGYRGLVTREAMRGQGEVIMPGASQLSEEGSTEATPG